MVARDDAFSIFLLNEELKRTPESSKSQGSCLFLFRLFGLIAPIQWSDALGGVYGNISSIGHQIWSEAVRKNQRFGDGVS